MRLQALDTNEEFYISVTLLQDVAGIPQSIIEIYWQLSNFRFIFVLGVFMITFYEFPSILHVVQKAH